jgi:hypothetical protein
MIMLLVFTKANYQMANQYITLDIQLLNMFFITRIKRAFDCYNLRYKEEYEMYNLNLNEMEKKRFKTTQSDLLKYNGHDFEILRELTDEEVDKELQPMFEVKFSDGFIIDVFVDEIFTDESLDKVFPNDEYYTQDELSNIWHSMGRSE